MDRLRRYFVEQGLDVRTPAGLGLGCGQAMDEVFRIDRARPRRIDRAEDEVDLPLGRAGALECASELAAQSLDVVGSDVRDLHFDARDPAILLLPGAIFPDSACSGTILLHRPNIS